MREEVITSHPFKVISNRRKNNVEKPDVFALKPQEGCTLDDVEIWIRGNHP
jgi:hypothetical protein